MTIIVTFEQGTGFNPRIVRITTTSDYAAVTAAGWLNSPANEGYIFNLTDKLLIAYDTNATTHVNFFDLTRTNGIYTLTLSSGEVIVPTVNGDFANFSGTAGAIVDLGFSPSDAAKTKVVMAGGAVVAARIAKFVDTAGTVDDTAGAATNLGDLYAGASGTAGVLRSYPATATTGYLGLTGVANAGAFGVQLSNASHAQSSVYTFNDIGAATGGIPVATAPFIMKQVAGAAAAGGAAAQSFTDAFCTSGSNVIGNWNTQANAVSVLKIVPGNGSFVVTSSGDAGVGTFNYVIMK